MVLSDDDKANDSSGWIALALTGIGFVPLFGSAIKGVGKVIIENARESLAPALAVMRKLGKGDPVSYLRKIDWADLTKQASDLIKEKIVGIRDALLSILNSKATWLLSDAAEKSLKKNADQLTAILPKVEQGLKEGMQNIEKRMNKALDEYTGEMPHSGVTNVPKKTKTDELNAPKGNKLTGARVASKSIDDLLVNGKVPSIRKGAFNIWFNKLSVDDMELLWENKSVREAIEARIRRPGGYHEWYMVSRTPKFKSWGINMEEIKAFRTEITELKWTSPHTGNIGSHGKDGSGKFHNELIKIIDNSNSPIEFKDKLSTLVTKWKIDPTIIP